MLCTNCKKPKDDPTWRLCAECREHARISTAKWRRANLAAVAAYSRKYQPGYRLRRIASDPSYILRERAILRRSVLNRTLKKYGLTQDDYNSLSAKGCGVCGGPPNGKGRYAFDHNHKTGKFRGLLCTRCNTALGSFLDNPKLLQQAVKYLQHME